MGSKLVSLAAAVFILAIMTANIVLAASVDLNQEVSDEDKANFDQIITPVMKIYNLVKYAASAIAGIALLFAGISYMSSGTDPRKRDNAKSMAMYVIIGLVIIWAAPLIVGLIVG
jgi:hypothetical protein